MNKQEAIEKIKNIDTLNINDIFAGQSVDMVIKNQVIDLISQIDEPQKPVVPKFVAEWIDTLDKHGLFGLNYDVVDESVWNWVYENYDCNVKKLHLAYLYGYEIEKEKLYTVEIDGVNSGKLFKDIRTNEYLFHCGSLRKRRKNEANIRRRFSIFKIGRMKQIPEEDFQFLKLEYYVKREGASEKDIRQEKKVLDDVALCQMLYR